MQHRTIDSTANWLQLCRTPGSVHGYLITKLGLHLSRPHGRHSDQETCAQHANSMLAGMIGGTVYEETGAEGRWGGNVAVTVGRAFHSARCTAKLLFQSVYGCKQDAVGAAGGLFHMSRRYAFDWRTNAGVLTAGTRSFLTSSTALLILISALDCVSSTVSRTWRSSFRCSQFGFPLFCSSWKWKEENKKKQKKKTWHIC